VSRNTVRRYLRDGEEMRYRGRPPRPSLLVGFEDYIAARVTAALPNRLSAVVLRELRERGYAGGYTILKDHLVRLRPAATAGPVVHFETAPGEQMQVGRASIRLGADRLSVFVATLGRSRAAYVEFVTDERLETLLAAHEHAFLAFGDVPREVLYDNMRTVVRERVAAAAAGTASIWASSISRGTAASGRFGASPTGRGQKARWNASSATCGRASGCRRGAGCRRRAWW